MLLGVGVALTVGAIGFAGLHAFFPVTPVPSPRYSVARVGHRQAPEFGVFVADFDGSAEWALDRAQALGVSWVAVEVRWGEWQFFPTTPLDWSALDAFMSLAEARGLRVMVRLTTAPAWSNSARALNAPPDDPRDYAAFALALASRYPATLGALEVWAGENDGRAWQTAAGASPRDYAALLQATYAAVKPAAPEVRIISGGLQTAGEAVVPETEFLPALIRAGGLSSADCVGIQHLDDSSGEPLLDRLEAYRRAAGASIPICLTSLGYAATTARSAGAGNETQADRLAEAVYNLTAFDPAALPLVVVYNLDAAVARGNPHAADAGFGLLDPDGSPRPAYESLQAALASLRRP